MKLALSNIAWLAPDDEAVYERMSELGFSGLEIAPPRLFPQPVYGDIARAASFAQELKATRGLSLCSMQSIWNGKTGNIFGGEAERAELLDYTIQAARFAAACGIKNLVLGCPRNRRLNGADPGPGLEFLRRAAAICRENGCRLALEANSPDYGTDFANTTAEAATLCRELAGGRLMLNLDTGAMLAARERVEEIVSFLPYVSHVHISEPGLAPIKRRPEHRELASALKSYGYSGFVSVEMARSDGLSAIFNAAEWLAEVFA